MVRGNHGGLLLCGILVGLVSWASPGQAQTESLFAGIDELSASMLGQTEEPEGSYMKFLRGIEGSGYINVAYSYNFNDSERGSSPGPETPVRIFDVFHNEFTVHNAALRLSKPVDEENPVGFSFIGAVGKDGAVTQDPNIALGGNDLDVHEANIKIRAPDSLAVLGGTTFTVGKFLTSAGAEVIDAPENTMFSRTLLFGLAIPFVHTGVKADFSLIKQEESDEDLLAGQLGVANGWGNHNVGSAGSGGNFPTWLTSATFTPGGDLEPSVTLNYFVGEVTASGRYRNLIDIVAGLQLTEALSFSGNFDWTSDEAGSATGGYSNLWGFAGILKYQVTDEVYTAVRLEHVDDHDGFASGSPTHVRIFDVTGTVGWMPYSNLLLRGEVRVDTADGGAPYENGTEHTQTTVSVDASFLF